MVLNLSLKEVQPVRELSPIFGDGRAGQAAAVAGWRSVGLAMTSIPSLNVTPRTSTHFSYGRAS
jgi:hypothetical protein